MRQIVESSGDIVSLSATIIVSTFAHPRAPEVEPQYRKSVCVKRLRYSKYNLVMKRAAEAQRDADHHPEQSTGALRGARRVH